MFKININFLVATKILLFILMMTTLQNNQNKQYNRISIKTKQKTKNKKQKTKKHKQNQTKEFFILLILKDL